ncbi:MAG: Unknown protein [uncultured Campylobacterales bacterium]|uniref:DUF3885 domain-containing protein n=1 Tax=uncultured Campylobacterales bacterium TaxID=352960 RepID=A0A6S6SLX6_9BACT|nr:MAG: Unknown protein [uncultured Campylobacterales bacterium]
MIRKLTKNLVKWNLYQKLFLKKVNITLQEMLMDIMEELGKWLKVSKIYQEKIPDLGHTILTSIEQEINTLTTISEKIFSKCTPLGYKLRDKYNKNWFRTHNFDDKRYPENLEDENSLQQQNKKIFKFIVPDKKPIGYITFFDNDIDVQDVKWIKDSKLNKYKKFNVSIDDDEIYLSQFYTFILDTNFLEDFILDIADDKVPCKTIIYSKTNFNIFAPYDGGVDLFLNNQMDLLEAKREFSDWISKRDDGL